MEEYGVLYCKTVKQAISNGTNIAVKSLLTNSYNEGECGGNTTDRCYYRQLDNDSMPNATSISNSVANQIVFTGVNFFTSGYVANASLSGMPADTVVIDSATQVTATWTMGLPPVNYTYVPELWFNSTGANYSLHYVPVSGNISLGLPQSLSTNTIDCSFAGGCTLELAADGLTGLLKNDSRANKITVCEETCEF